MEKKYTLRMEIKMEEPEDYEDFEWKIINAISSCCVNKEVVVRNMCLEHGWKDIFGNLK